MSNMSYCRFQNTSRDLQDCLEALADGLETLSDSEKSAAKAIRNMCEDFIVEYDDQEEES